MKQHESESKPKFQVADRRFWVEDPGLEDQATVPEEHYPSFVEELRARTEAAENKLRQRVQELDVENAAFRDRLNRQLEKRISREKVEFFRELLEVADNLERALDASTEGSNFEALREGLRLNLDLFQAKLSLAGLEVIDPLEQPFDPNEAEALGLVPVSDIALDNKVVRVEQKGYRLGDQVVRPSTVLVGRYEE